MFQAAAAGTLPANRLPIMLEDVLVERVARSRGIKTERLRDRYLRTEYKGEVYLFKGGWCSKTNSALASISANKQATKAVLAANGAAVPRGEIFKPQDGELAKRYAAFLGYPVVVKPNSGSKGKLVTFVTSEDTFPEAFENVASGAKTILVEQMVGGDEYRFLTVEDRVVAVARRVPANVVGDGQRTIRALIAAKNLIRGRSRAQPQIKVTDSVEAYLAAQKLSQESIPAKGQQVFLRQNSNVSTGGDAVDVTNAIHPGYKAALLKAAVRFRAIFTMGYDVLIRDPSVPPTPENWAIIEANYSPMFCLHHYPWNGAARDVAGTILRKLYPEAFQPDSAESRVSRKTG